MDALKLHIVDLCRKLIELPQVLPQIRAYRLVILILRKDAEFKAVVHEELVDILAILRNGSKFENAFAFKNGNLTNLLFPFEEEIDINIGKLAVWRIGTHEQFGGTWLSDYVPNQLGGFTELTSPTEEMEMEP